ncbi:MAG: hypothetical protein H0T89_23905 [Deltaproteobacteria bacterium]|nr:hypothetical protein [Deltaproteobacteria bacterium]MDQ3300434.1 hypothetical protein [Myxococcota bacterium]
MRECTVRCEVDGDCAPEQGCGVDGWCATPGQIGQCADVVTIGGIFDGPDAIVVDAGLPADAMISDAAVADAPIAPDAPGPSCAPGCPGSCQAGVCVIECSGNKSCADGVTCPDDGPCRVVCSGNMSCEKRVRCGDGPCTVLCLGNMSCEAGVRCEDSCACDVTCTGNACGDDDDDVRCSSPACETQNGCTSARPGCNQC